MRFLLVAIMLMMGVSCATPVPEPHCSDGVNFVLDEPDKARNLLNRACYHHSKMTGHSIRDVSKALEGVDILIYPMFQFSDCSEGVQACARQYSDGHIIIQVERENWTAWLLHELHHSLLLKLQPDLSPNKHHSYMLNNGMCHPFIALCVSNYSGPRRL